MEKSDFENKKSKKEKKMYIKRSIESIIKKTAKDYPVLLVTGPRQVGKTTVLKMCEKEKFNYVSLDKLSERMMAKETPELFLQRYKAPLVIDEVQYAPELFPYIKAIVDEQQENGMYWLTGSQQFHLMKNVTESLAGRIAVLKLLGFSQREKLDTKNNESFVPSEKYISYVLNKKIKNIEINHLYETIWRGSFPKINVNKNMDWEIFYSSYLETYIERDIKSLSNINNELTFVKFMTALAARTGQLLNYSDISKDIGISEVTVKAWVSLLRTSGIIYLLEPYYKNISKRMIKMPKIYFLDTGFACYLTKWNTPEVLQAGAMNGAFFETYVISEIIKSYWHNGRQAPIYFYRDKDKKEIDILIEENGILYPVEIKKTDTPTKDDIGNFKILETSKLKIGEGAVVCLASNYIPLTEKVNILPINYL